jgi:hypothetical protein
MAQEERGTVWVAKKGDSTARTRTDDNTNQDEYVNSSESKEKPKECG